jgi:hypothetical protein
VPGSPKPERGFGSVSVAVDGRYTEVAMTVPPSRRSVVIAGLKKIDPLRTHRIDQPMFLGDAARPRIGKNVSQRFGFSDALERIPHHRFHEVNQSKGDAAIIFDPVS